MKPLPRLGSTKYAPRTLPAREWTPYYKEYEYVEYDIDTGECLVKETCPWEGYCPSGDVPLLDKEKKTEPRRQCMK